ncbi:hypothetical protein [Sphingomonas sp.]|jgi:hypothetical protein|uniref:hypothetical protein n=1 Tax=Sphingomonas sp. TaxID=28214 RepID=UPI002EDBB4CD
MLQHLVRDVPMHHLPADDDGLRGVRARSHRVVSVALEDERAFMLAEERFTRGKPGLSSSSDEIPGFVKSDHMIECISRSIGIAINTPASSA